MKFGARVYLASNGNASIFQTEEAETESGQFIQVPQITKNRQVDLSDDAEIAKAIRAALKGQLTIKKAK